MKVRGSFVDRFIEEDRNTSFWSIKKKVGVFLVVMFLAVVMINTTGCTKNGAEVQPESQATPSDNAAVTPASTPSGIGENPGMVTVGNDGVRAGLAGENTTGVDNKMVNVAVADSGRTDPLLPYPESGHPRPKVVRSSAPHLPYLMLPPLENVKTDSNAEKVLTTKVSGIMYDNYSPSAILNIEGTDYLVRSGDVINNYKVLSISKKVVTVQLGSNVYRAGVGQILTSGGVQYTHVANLRHKFGGAR